MKYVYPFLPRCGLGNLLFPWARSVVYRRSTGAQMIAPVWTRVSRIGPWIRGERYKRFYGGEFTNDGYISGLKRWWLLHFAKADIHVERGMSGFFEPFLEELVEVRRELLSIVNPSIVRRVQGMKREKGNYVAVHVRRGDFTQAGCKTEDDWFVRGVAAALDLEDAKGRSAILVFSDGYPDELNFLSEAFKAENVVVMPKAPAIQDILMLSEASVLVCSPQSTFSMWGAFLGQIPSVWKKSAGLEPPRLYLNEAKEIYIK